MLKQLTLMLTMALWLTMPTATSRAQDYSTAVEETADSAVDAAKATALAPHGAEHAVEEHADAHGAHDAAHESPPLLPDPTSRTTQLQALWVVIIFVVLLMILYPTAWRNILAGLKKREEGIRKDIADAEAARARAEQTLKDYSAKLAAAENEVREMIGKATADAERAAAGIRTRAQQEAEETKERAIKDIDAAAKQAMAEVYEQTATLATSVAAKILRRNLNADDQRDLVNQSLDQLQTIKG